MPAALGMPIGRMVRLPFGHEYFRSQIEAADRWVSISRDGHQIDHLYHTCSGRWLLEVNHEALDEPPPITWDEFDEEAAKAWFFAQYPDEAILSASRSASDYFDRLTRNAKCWVSILPDEFGAEILLEVNETLWFLSRKITHRIRPCTEYLKLGNQEQADAWIHMHTAEAQPDDQKVKAAVDTIWQTFQPLTAAERRLVQKRIADFRL